MVAPGALCSAAYSNSAPATTMMATIVNSEPAMRSVEMFLKDRRTSRIARSTRSIGTSTITRSSGWLRTKSHRFGDRASRTT
jgi:hypothetical protein